LHYSDPHNAVQSFPYASIVQRQTLNFPIFNKIAKMYRFLFQRDGNIMEKPLVGVVMGSNSDWPVMEKAVEQLEAFGVPYEAKVVSAHRTPDLLADYAKTAQERGLSCIIAGAGGAAHLPGMLAAFTTVPVLGVPVPSKYLKGEDSLLSIVQMPKGIPVATFAIGEAGAANAGLFAIAQLATKDAELNSKLLQFRQEQAERVFAMTLPPQ
jgi:5-(carboxyamino)imidazole ribonucleotide mutase